MEKDLYGFLHPEMSGEEEVIVSKRFKDKAGKPVPFVIRPLTQEENEVLIKKNTKTEKNGERSFAQMAYVADMIAAAVIFPDLKNAELQKAYGVLGEAKLLKAMLYSGEYATLSTEVQRLSGFDVSEEELAEEAKNE